MSRRIKKQITSVQYYACGYCTNELSFAFKNHKSERRVFPSGVFLIKHPSEGYILFDTGYSQSILKMGFRGWLYCHLNPTYVKKSDEIVTQLDKEGISRDEIKYIVLSHLHPDHIGGVKFFPNSTIIISEGSYQTYKNPRWNDLLFPQLLPDWFEKKLQVISKNDRQQVQDTMYGHDLFRDGSLFLVELEGHAQGQIGAYIPGQLLLAADVCWGNDLLSYSRHMRLPAKFILHDYGNFIKSLDLVDELKKKDTRLYFSHGLYEEKEILR